jgi:hypothetical protein
MLSQAVFVCAIWIVQILLLWPNDANYRVVVCRSMTEDDLKARIAQLEKEKRTREFQVIVLDARFSCS